MLLCLEHFSDVLALMAQQMDEGVLQPDEVVISQVVFLVGLLQSFVEKNFTKLNSQTIKVIVYALMQGLSSQHTVDILKENIGLIRDLAAYMDGTDDEEWEQDWISWCDAVNGLLQ